VIKVTSGFKRGKEINRVTYDPAKISPEEMVSALKEAGTFVGIDTP
jgi:hypothetical protein